MVAGMCVWMEKWLINIQNPNTVEKNKKEIVIAHSDYTRAQLEKDEVHELTVGNCSARAVLDVIRQYEKAGYVITFNTSVWRRLFKLTKYQVVATAKEGKEEKKVKYIGLYTITTNGVSRNMTEEEVEKFENLLNEKRKLMEGVFDGMDKLFDAVEKTKK